MLNKTLKEKNKTIATILAFAVIPISGLATDIYLPSMPNMGIVLGASESQIQLTLSLFLISYGITQFFTGAIVDTFGRYKVSILSLFFFVISFGITANTNNLYIIYVMRIVQGILSGFAVVAKRAYFVDVFEGEERRHYLSIMTIVWSLAPIIAPFIGGYLQTHFDWQANFSALAIYCLAVLLLELIFSGETIKIRNPISINFLFTSFNEMFKTIDFFYGMLICAVSYSLIMFYNLCGPFIIEHTFGYTAITTGYISLLMGIAWMCGGFLGKVLMNKALLPKIKAANYLQMTFIIIMIASSFWISTLYTLAIFAFLVHVTAGFMFNNYFSYCLGRFPHAAGIAGGLTGGVAYVLTSAISYAVVAVLKPESQQYLAFGYFIIALLGLGVLVLIKYRKDIS